MQASCDMAFKYAHVREQFGQKIGTFQVRMIIVYIIMWILLNLLSNYQVWMILSVPVTVGK